MTEINKDGRATGAEPLTGTRRGAGAGAKQTGDMPGWTNGLRQLYDQVVDEDLPDAFRDLLARLDDKS